MKQAKPCVVKTVRMEPPLATDLLNFSLDIKRSQNEIIIDGIKMMMRSHGYEINDIT